MEELIKYTILKIFIANSMKGRHNMKITIKRFIIISMAFILVVLNKSYIYANEDIFIKNGSRDKKIIALTFDDGPHPKETNEILNVLKKYNIKATFFIAGKHANWYSKPLIRASDEGHELGNHTFSHPDISKLNKNQLEKEILECEEMLIKLTGQKTKLFRPPYGSYDKDVLEEIAKKYGYKIVLWTTLDAKDWKNPGANKISDTIVNNAKNGDIVLLHDYATENTVEALDILIPKMLEKGYKFATVSELINN